MNIEALAREAGMAGMSMSGSVQSWGAGVVVPRHLLERFAAVVLEEAAKVCDDKERRKLSIFLLNINGASTEGTGPLDCAAAIRALKEHL